MTKDNDKRTFFNLRLYLPYILIVTFTLLFYQPLFAIYDRLLITPFFSHIHKPNWATVLALVIIVSLFVYFFITMVKRKTRLSFHLQASIITVVVVYSIYRCSIPGSFTQLIAWIKISDIIFLPFVYVVASWLIEYSKPFNKNSSIGYIQDEPLESMPSGFRSDLANEVAEKILLTMHDKTSFAFGIVGEWGSGKTTFMNQLKGIFTEEDKRDYCEVISFNPWQVETPSAITSEFFNAFADNLNRLLIGFRMEVNDYASSLVKDSKEGVISSFISKTIFLFRKEKKTLEQKHRAVQEGIEKIGKKIIVFIDDLDRLLETEINEVLRLIRNSANFGNVVFVVAYDRKHVENILGKVEGRRGGKYLDKIFQANVVINSYRHQTILNELLLKLSLVVDKNDLNLLENSDWRNYYNFVFFEKQLKNIRDVIRYSNLMITYYPLFKDKIFFPDFFRLLFIRLQYPAVYYDIQAKSEVFFTTYSYFNDDHQKLCLVQKNDNDKYEYDNKNAVVTESTSRLREYLIGSGILEEDAINIEHAFINIFPTIKDNHYQSFSLSNFKDPEHIGIADKSFMAVNYVRNFDTYFDLDNTGLSYSEFIETFQKDDMSLKYAISVWYAKGWISEFDFRIRRLNRYSTTADYYKILMSILWASEIEKMLVASETVDYKTMMMEKLLLKDEFSNSEVSKIFETNEDYLKFFYDFLEANAANKVVILILYDIIMTEYSNKYSLEGYDKVKLFDILSDEFENYINTNSIVNDKFEECYYPILRASNKLGVDISLLNEKIRKKVVASDVDSFILYALEINIRDSNFIRLNEGMTAIFDGNIESMLTFLDSYSQKSIYYSDFRSFIEMVLSRGKAGSYYYVLEKIPQNRLRQFGP